MSFAATALSALLLALAIAQLPYVVAFVRTLRRPDPALPDDAACPPALVVLPLRGADPTLSRCLTGLIGQDYPRFDVRVVVDGRDDPAWEVVRSVLDEHPAADVRVEELRDRRTGCSLKCSSLLQALTALEPRHAFVAQIDADVLPHRTWLRELAAGFRDPSVGAVTGNRWYVPSPPTWGALVRWLWNLAAVPQMYVYGVVWGGTMAVRTELLESAGLLERWARAYGEDTTLTSALWSAGFDVRFVPSLLMVEEGTCSLPETEAWILRQLVSLRLHHRAWPAVVAHGVATSAALLLVFLAGAAALAAGQTTGARVALAALLAYGGLMAVSVAVLESSARSRIRRRGETPRRLAAGSVLRSLLAMPLTQAVHARAVLAACFARSVRWRGVRYDLVGGGGVRRVEDPEPRRAGGG